MGYTLKIEQYKILKEEFVTPLAEAPRGLTVSHKKNDPVFIIGDDVWVKNYNIDEDDTYSKAIYSPEFVRINPWLFEKTN